MHEENFLSSWLREDGKKKEEGRLDMSKESIEGNSKKEKKRRGDRRERSADLF